MKILFITVSLIFLGCSQESNNAEKLMSYDFQPDLNKIPVEGCPAILNHEIRLLDSKEVINLCKHKDKVILAVNVASRCGFTYQYEALQNLFDGYKEEDFVILGFSFSRLYVSRVR